MDEYLKFVVCKVWWRGVVVVWKLSGENALERFRLENLSEATINQEQIKVTAAANTIDNTK